MLRDIPEEQSLDLPGVLRLAKEWARLYLQWELQEDDFTKMKNDLEEPFKEFFDLVEDAKTTGRTYLAPLTQIPDKKPIDISLQPLLQLESGSVFKILIKSILPSSII